MREHRKKNHFWEKIILFDIEKQRELDMEHSSDFRVPHLIS